MIQVKVGKRTSRNRRIAASKISWVAIRGSMVRAIRPFASGMAAALVVIIMYISVQSGIQMVAAHEFFCIREVTVKGNRRVARELITAKSGIRASGNFFSTDLERAAQLIAAIQWISEVRVSRQFPGIIAVDISEFEPAGLASMGPVFVFDEEGFPVKLLSHGDRLDFPVVTGLTFDSYAADPQAFRRRLVQAAELAAQYSMVSNGKHPEISEIVVENDEFVLVLAGKTRVQVGTAGFPEKLKRLNDTLLALGPRAADAKTIYLNNQKRPNLVAVAISGQPHDSGAY